MLFSLFPHMRYRRALAHAYWVWLTCELLLPNPWVLFGGDIAAHPPVDTSSDISSGLLHLGAFCVLALLLLWSRYPFRSHMRSAIVLSIVFSLVSETTQRFIPLRSFSFSDVLFNLLGIGIGCGVFFLILKLKDRTSVLETASLVHDRSAA